MHPTDIELAAGDQLLLYTDGIVEAFGGGEMFGFPRLRTVFAAAAERGPQEVVAAVFRAVSGFAEKQEDDMTLLAVEYTGAAA